MWGGGWLATLGDCATLANGTQEDVDCINRGGAIDFAGGIVIHTTAGVGELRPALRWQGKQPRHTFNLMLTRCWLLAASLVVALVLGPRTGFDPSNTSWNTESRPHSIPLAVIGAAMLWMGWFGFNAGSALASGAGEFPAAPLRTGSALAL